VKLIPEKDFPELQRDPKSGYWIVRKKKDGRELFRSTGEKRNKHKARKKALAILAEWLGTENVGGGVTFKSVGEEVILLKARRSHATQVSARLHLRKHLYPFFGAMLIADGKKNPLVNEATWERYETEERLKNPTRRLFNDWKHFRMVTNLAWKKGLIARKVVVQNPDPEIQAGKVYSDREVRRLLRAANPQLRTQIIGAVTMGLRRKENLCQTWDRHIDLRRRIVHLPAKDTKIRRSRSCGMSRTFYEAIVELWRAAGRPKAGPVYPSRHDKSAPTRSHKTAWRSCKRRAGVTGRFHDLRHTFLTNALIRDRKNPLHVSVYAGVSLTEIQRTYLHPSVDDTRGVAAELPAGGEKRGEGEE
jgi:integrase